LFNYQVIKDGGKNVFHFQIGVIVMSAETGMPFSSASRIRSEFRGVNVKVVRFLEFQMGPCLQEIQELWVTDHQVVARMKNGDRS
jgi:hypothetical protein